MASTIPEDVLRREMESKMTEEERIVRVGTRLNSKLAARMAKIAEMAEKKNSAEKPNSVLKELISSKIPKQDASILPTQIQVGAK